LARRQGVYLSAQLKHDDERSAEERTRDIDALLHAHGTRSDQVGEIVAARGLNAHF
jgi:hypothetical protein